MLASSRSEKATQERWKNRTSGLRKSIVRSADWHKRRRDNKGSGSMDRVDSQAVGCSLLARVAVSPFFNAGVMVRETILEACRGQ